MPRIKTYNFPAIPPAKARFSTTVWLVPGTWTDTSSHLLRNFSYWDWIVWIKSWHFAEGTYTLFRRPRLERSKGDSPTDCKITPHSASLVLLGSLWLRISMTPPSIQMPDITKNKSIPVDDGIHVVEQQIRRLTRQEYKSLAQSLWSWKILHLGWVPTGWDAFILGQRPIFDWKPSRRKALLNSTPTGIEPGSMKKP